MVFLEPYLTATSVCLQFYNLPGEGDKCTSTEAALASSDLQVIRAFPAGSLGQPSQKKGPAPDSLPTGDKAGCICFWFLLQPGQATAGPENTKSMLDGLYREKQRTINPP